MMDDITDYRKVLRDMKELWKETFHDSSRYIDLVFETYFNRHNVFVRYAENRLIASMLCIPYEFQILIKGYDKRHLKGVYLCGLSTRHEYRSQGIMTGLMAEAEEAWKERGYDLSFLIPADSHLREYYKRKGYLTSSYREKRICTKQKGERSEGKNSELYIYTIRKLFTSEENGLHIVGQLAEWCRDIELKRNYPTVIHSKRDMMTVMRENENSIFITKGPMNLKNSILANVVAVAFPEIPEGSHELLRLVGFYCQDEISNEIKNETVEDKWTMSGPTHLYNRSEIQKMYQSILKRFNCMKMEVVLPYEGEYKDRGGIEAYAMIKPLRKLKFLPSMDNLKFEISLMLD